MFGEVVFQLCQVVSVVCIGGAGLAVVQIEGGAYAMQIIQCRRQVAAMALGLLPLPGGLGGLAITNLAANVFKR